MRETKEQPLSKDASTAFRLAFQQHGAFVCRCLRMLAVPTDDLDDALQEVFLVVFQRMHVYEERGLMRSWLYSICRRVSWGRRRTVRRRREDYVDYPDSAADPEQHERAVEQQAIAQGLQLLNGLPPEQRDVFWMHEVEELPMSAIARAIDCPMQTAYSRLHKARERVLAAAKLMGATHSDLGRQKWSTKGQKGRSRGRQAAHGAM